MAVVYDEKLRQKVQPCKIYLHDSGGTGKLAKKNLNLYSG